MNVLINAIIGFGIGFVWGHVKGESTRECVARGFFTVIVSTLIMALLGAL